MQTTPPENIDPIYIHAIIAEDGVRRDPVSLAASREITIGESGLSQCLRAKNTLPRTLGEQENFQSCTFGLDHAGTLRQKRIFEESCSLCERYIGKTVSEANA
jgi:hypothetical protein